MTDGLDISVVICVYTMERWNDLLRAVASVRDQSVSPREIIVVVDHNLSLLAHARAHLSHVCVVENGGLQGLNTARNTGVAHAAGEVIAFLDDDAIAAPDWLEQLQVGYGDPHVLGVGGTIEPLWHSQRPTWFPDEFLWVVGCTYRGLPETMAPVRNLIGCNMSFRREAFEAVGGFRLKGGMRTADVIRPHARPATSERPIACEETDFCVRARQRWPERVLLFNPRARVWHHVPPSRAAWRYYRSRCYFEGRSKALLAHLVGARDGLSAERRHALRTVPSGALQQLAGALWHRDVAGLARAGAIVAGLTSTAAGYLAGTLSSRHGAEAAAVALEDASSHALRRPGFMDPQNQHPDSDMHPRAVEPIVRH
jgi:glycosyltransferase involved in cell wall biosynthesis